MPYVPSKKTDGKSDDRVRIDEAVEILANQIVESTGGDVKKLTGKYLNTLIQIGNELRILQNDPERVAVGTCLASTVFDVGEKYKYDGAWFGELNYAITRLIQVVPRIATEKGYYSSEIRYWLYAMTAGVLKHVSDHFSCSNGWVEVGLTGIFIDILHEYKRRVNTAYEVAQIIKSGDCYTTPYLTQPAEVVDTKGNVIGHIEIMMKREDYDGKDVSGVIRIEK